MWGRPPEAVPVSPGHLSDLSDPLKPLVIVLPLDSYKSTDHLKPLGPSETIVNLDLLGLFCDSSPP